MNNANSTRTAGMGPDERRAVRPPFSADNPATGLTTGVGYRAASETDVERAARAAGEAFDALRESAARRAKLLDAIAEGVAGLGERLPAVAAEETGLPASPRLAGERDRAVSQLRMFARVVRAGRWVEAVIDRGDPARTPLPKPDLRRMLVPLGPAAVFGASNFPIAFGVAGGDTASALAAGCPVVVKGHPLHPGTGELVAGVVHEAVRSAGLPTGVFGYLPAGGEREVEVGLELVAHAEIKAVGFTGSTAAGMALVKAAAARAEPIPVFAEMGSTNPVFILPGALMERTEEIAEKLAASITASCGQMCTRPGIIFVAACESADRFCERLSARLGGAPAMTMLSARIRAAFGRHVEGWRAISGVTVVGGPWSEGESERGVETARAALAVTDDGTFAAQPGLWDECFGPAAIVVRCRGEGAMRAAARNMPGNLTATVWSAAGDAPRAGQFVAALSQRCGRVVFNGVPTGVEVCDAMVHSGPFPACSRPESSSVGVLAIRRWCRPVAFQNVPDALLPPELQEANPLRIERVEDGATVAPCVTPARRGGDSTANPKR